MARRLTLAYFLQLDPPTRARPGAGGDVKDVIAGVLVGAAVGVVIACVYVMGFLRARIKFSEDVLSPWLEWRLVQLERVRDMAPTDALAVLDDLKTDSSAFEALTGVVHKVMFPWDRAPKYTRPEVTP